MSESACEQEGKTEMHDGYIFWHNNAAILGKVDSDLATLSYSVCCTTDGGGATAF